MTINRSISRAVAALLFAAPTVFALGIAKAGANQAGTDGTPVGTTQADTIRCWTIQQPEWQPVPDMPWVRQRSDGRYEVAVGTDKGSEPACVEAIPGSGIWVNPDDLAAVSAFLKSKDLEARGVTLVAGEEVPTTLDLPEWVRLADCESGGRWHITDRSGIHGGGLQIATPGVANWSIADQIAHARTILDRQGPRAWPACSRILGWR